jgi:hypothetical protein
VCANDDQCTTTLLVTATIEDEGSSWDLMITLSEDDVFYDDRTRAWSPQQEIRIQFRRFNNRIEYPLDVLKPVFNAFERREVVSPEDIYDKLSITRWFSELSLLGFFFF